MSSTDYLQQLDAFNSKRGDFAEFQRIRLKHINEMLGQLNQDATGIHLLMVEKKAIEEFLGIEASMSSAIDNPNVAPTTYSGIIARTRADYTTSSDDEEQS